MNNQTNYTMLCDFYELSMANGYFQTPLKDRITYFDVFFRTIPDEGGFAITAGLEQVVNYIQNLTFTDEDIEYLRSKGGFVEEFLDYLKNFKFTGDIWAIPEGTTVFPREPILTVRAPAIQAQFIETYIADRYQVQPHRSGCRRSSCGRIRFPPCPGRRSRHLGCPRLLHRRLRRHRLRPGRPRLSCACHRYHGSFLGSDVPR